MTKPTADDRKHPSSHVKTSDAPEEVQLEEQAMTPARERAASTEPEPPDAAADDAPTPGSEDPAPDAVPEGIGDPELVDDVDVEEEEERSGSDPEASSSPMGSPPRTAAARAALEPAFTAEELE